MREKLLFEFNVECPKYQNQVISLNNIEKWYRFHKSKIKNQYKQNLKDFYIPTPDKTYEGIVIDFKLYRHNGKTLDSDNMGFIIKWTIDAIKEINWETQIINGKEKTVKNPGWIIDDDNVEYSVTPAVLDRSLLETEVNIKVYARKNV